VKHKIKFFYINLIYHNSKSGLDCNLGKNLSKSREDDQLVK